MEYTTDAYPFPMGASVDWVKLDDNRVMAVKLAGKTFYLREVRGRLEVVAYHSISVRPRAGNVVYLDSEV